MSDTLTVPTAFNDISQLAEGMADRVDEERLMLYGPEPVQDNSWVRFNVLLMDESVALEGIGRAVASIDGGDERPEVARFDIVLDNLQFEGTSEVVYERMLLMRSQAFSEGPGTGEVSLDDVQQVEEEVAASTGFEDESTQIAPEHEYSAHVEASAMDEGYDSGGATAVAPALEEPEYSYAEPSGGYEDAGAQVESWDDSASTESEGYADVGTGEIALPEESWSAKEEYASVDEVVSVPPSAPPPAPPSAPPPVLVNPLVSGSDGPLLRRSRGATWTPKLEPAPPSRLASGLFGYTGGLPIPPHPPRPDLDPSLRIHPAPRPSASGHPAAHATRARHDDAGTYEDPNAVPDDTDSMLEVGAEDFAEDYADVGDSTNVNIESPEERD
jgi:hypothetical protein